MSPLAFLLMILAVLVQIGFTAEHGRTHADVDVHVHAGRDYVVASDSCRFTEGRLSLEREDPFHQGSTVSTDLRFRGESPAEATRQVSDAYGWWSRQYGAAAADWFVDEARSQGVEIHLAGGDRISSIYFHFGCDYSERRPW